jgi:hypothetical protein
MSAETSVIFPPATVTLTATVPNRSVAVEPVYVPEAAWPDAGSWAAGVGEAAAEPDVVPVSVVPDAPEPVDPEPVVPDPVVPEPLELVVPVEGVLDVSLIATAAGTACAPSCQPPTRRPADAVTEAKRARVLTD